MEHDNPIKYSLVLIAIIVFFWAIFHARAFLVPLSFAVLLAMLMVPVSNVLERWGFRRTWSSLTSTLIIVMIAAVVVFLLSSPASRFTSELPRLLDQVTHQYQKIRQTVQNQWGIGLPTQSNLLTGGASRSPSDASPTKERSVRSRGSAAGASSQSPPATSEASPASSASSESGATASGSWFSSIIRTLTNIFTGAIAILGDMLLTMVYVFALLFYRDKFQEFLWRLTPEVEHPRVARIIDNASRVARQYLWGRLLLIIILAIFYGTGFLIIGLQHALFLAVFASLFSIIPYIGPILGIALPILVSLMSQNSPTLVLWVLAVFAVAQFIESYLLEPLVVGAEVHVNPFFTIVAVVAGSLLWGVPGLILAIPIVGIIRVIFDNFDSLQPYGYLIGQQETSYGWNKAIEKIKNR
jgi:predicted PurR-regulated permease PerM